MQVTPSEANSGYTFVRNDVEEAYSKVIATYSNVTNSCLSTTITNSDGIEIMSINHILAALYACNIDNAIIYLDGPEVPPCIDGSAVAFVALIHEAGFIQQNAERKAIIIKQPITISDEINFSSFLPNIEPSVSIVKFASNNSPQYYFSKLSEETFTNDIAPARTFIDIDEVNFLHESGRAQGVSKNNIIIYEDDVSINNDELYFKDEFIRYRYLEHVSSLALVGATFFGEYNSVYLNRKFKNIPYCNWLDTNKDKLHYTTLREALTNYHEILK